MPIGHCGIDAAAGRMAASMSRRLGARHSGRITAKAETSKSNRGSFAAVQDDNAEEVKRLAVIVTARREVNVGEGRSSAR